VADAHEVCDVIEQGIRQLFKDAHANIHLEPCEAFHPQCLGGCALPQKAVKKTGGGSHGK
jgi:hypothetical protein